MPTHRSLVCADCATAFALPADHGGCPRCGGELEPLAADRGAARYFSRGLIDDR